MPAGLSALIEPAGEIWSVVLSLGRARMRASVTCATPVGSALNPLKMSAFARKLIGVPCIGKTFFEILTLRQLASPLNTYEAVAEQDGVTHERSVSAIS